VELGSTEVEGFRIGYARAGEGPALLLLHGGWNDSREWRRQLEDLSDEFTVVAWDAPGCGRSSDPPEVFSLADYADIVAGLIRTLDLGRPHLLGLSFGGGLAIEVAHRHPTAIRSLVLASAYAGWAGSLPPDVVEERVATILAEADQPPEVWVPAHLSGAFAGPVAPATLAELAEIMTDARPAGVKPMATAFAEADLRGALRSIAVPTLLLYGERDDRAPPPVGQAINRGIPGSRLVILPGVGHLLNLEATEAFNREVRRFLRTVPPNPIR
jgi:pimeloyl-ACP methyl ester carboxylesterase